MTSTAKARRRQRASSARQALTRCEAGLLARRRLHLIPDQEARR
jgi:hypothetical protein